MRPAEAEASRIRQAVRIMSRIAGALTLVLAVLFSEYNASATPPQSTVASAPVAVESAQNVAHAQQSVILADSAQSAIQALNALVPQAPATDTYTIKPGDTLGEIAAAHGTSAPALAALNGIGNPNVIAAGAVLKVTGSAPAPTVETPKVETVAYSTSTSPAARRQSALATALAQVGKPYRYGATGPSAFDCSGLMQYSFNKAGVSIPRTSRAQSGFGTPVSKGSLQPGDMVFFYKPVSHVGMYIGNGQVVHASTSGQPVKISSLNAMPFSGARRV